MIEETFVVNSVKIEVKRPDNSAAFSYGELEELANHCNTEPNAYLRHIKVKVGEDGYLDLEKHYEPYPFERIRRITGYLVGTVDRFNNAKKAEERDRVKHSVKQQDADSFLRPLRPLSQAQIDEIVREGEKDPIDELDCTEQEEEKD